MTCHWYQTNRRDIFKSVGISDGTTDSIRILWVRRIGVSDIIRDIGHEYKRWFFSTTVRSPDKPFYNGLSGRIWSCGFRGPLRECQHHAWLYRVPIPSI